MNLSGALNRHPAKDKPSNVAQRLSLQEQLDLFHNKQIQLRNQEKEEKERELIQKSVMRIKSRLLIYPEIDHDCSSANCQPTCEESLIYTRQLLPPCVNRDVYVCRYGRVHICNRRSGKCVIEIDNNLQGTCRISGRHYGDSGLTQVRAIGHSHDNAEHLDDPEGSKVEDGDFSRYYDLDADGRGDDEGSNDDLDYESLGVTSYHPFNPPTSHAQTVFLPNSKYVKKLDIVKETKPSITTPQIISASQPIPKLGPPRVPLQSLHSSTKTNKKKDSKPTILQRSSVKNKQPLVPVSSSILSLPREPEPIQELLPSDKAQIDLEYKADITERQVELTEILKHLFYSPTRVQVAKHELSRCLEEAKKSVSGEIRQIRNLRQKEKKQVVLPLFHLFVIYYNHITINYTQLSAAPTDSGYMDRTVNIILTHWRSVFQYLRIHQIPVTKLHFVQNTLAILYEMRKGGRELKPDYIIPFCEYTRTYLPPMDLIERFGYKKNYITTGFTLLLQSYK